MASATPAAVSSGVVADLVNWLPQEVRGGATCDQADRVEPTRDGFSASLSA
jgi:hypothetical protein